MPQYNVDVGIWTYSKSTISIEAESRDDAILMVEDVISVDDVIDYEIEDFEVLDVYEV